MGRSIDISAKGKKLNVKYPLDRFYGVSALLQNIHYIREMRFTRGDYDASILLIDFVDSLHEAELTDRQKFVLQLIFIEGKSQYEVARKLNITQQAVSDHINSAIARIAAVNKQKEDRSGV